MADSVGREMVVEQIGADTFFRHRIGEPRELPHQARLMHAIRAHYSRHDFVG